MMGIRGFKTKKELKAAAAQYIPANKDGGSRAIGVRPSFIETSIFGNEYRGDGEYTIVGPDPYDRRWYATITVKDGLISKVT